MAGVLSEAWGTPPIGSRAHPSALIEMPHSDAAAPAAPPNPYARHPVGARDRSQPGTKWCLWEVLKDYRRGLPISDMLREIVNRGLRNFDGNKNPLGQIAGDLVRDRAHFFHFSGTNIWCLRCYVPQKLLEESGEPPPVARIAKEARPKPASDAGRGGGGRKQQAQARGNARAGGGVGAAPAPARAAPRRAASAGVATAIAAAAHGPAPELDMAPGCGAPGITGAGTAAATISRSISDTGQQHAAAAPGTALHTLLAMQQASQGLGAAARPQPGKQQLVRMQCKIWSENEGQYRTGEVVGYDPSSDLHQVSYGNRDMDLGIRFLSYEVVAAPEAPTGVAVAVQRAQIMPQLSTRTDTAQASFSMAAQPAGIRRATSADRADGGGSARLIRPIARSFVTPQPSSPLDTASSSWTALMQASGGSFFPSPAAAFSQPGDFARPGSGAWHGMQTPLSKLAALSPPGLPTGWFSQPLPISRAASATAAELQQAAGWQQGLHSMGSGHIPFAPTSRGLPPVAPAAAIPQHSGAEAMSAAPLSAAALTGGLTLQDVVRAGLISPANPAQQSAAHAADGSSSHSYMLKAAAGAHQPAMASSKYAGDDAFSMPAGTLVTAGGSDASAATAAGNYLAHLGEDQHMMLPYETQRHMLAPAPAQASTGARRAGGLPEDEHLTALHGSAAVDELGTGYAAHKQTDSSAARQAYRPHPQGSTLDKHGNDMMGGGRSAGGIASIIGAAKRPRLGGNGDQHFVQQPLSVAQ